MNVNAIDPTLNHVELINEMVSIISAIKTDESTVNQVYGDMASAYSEILEQVSEFEFCRVFWVLDSNGYSVVFNTTPDRDSKVRAIEKSYNGKATVYAVYCVDNKFAINKVYETMK